MKHITAVVLTFVAMALLFPVTAHALTTRAPLGGAQHGGAPTPVPVKAKKHHRAKHHGPAPIAVKILSAGYQDQYRSLAWMPIRVSLHNRTGATISGSAQVPDSGNNSYGPPPQFKSLYQMPVVLPAGATKQVTLYVPGYDQSGEVDVNFVSDGKTLGSGQDYPANLSASDIVIGSMTSDPANAAWLSQVNPLGSSVDFARLTPDTLDPVPDALATFDVIVLTDTDTSRLDADQIQALRGFVANGGGLVLVGGPNWQTTLRPLASALVPGRLTGTATVTDLSGLAAVGGSGLKRMPVTVSVLDPSQGTVVASERATNGTTVPLIVRQNVGLGQILYLAFDPADNPVHGTRGASLINHLVALANPYATSRTGWSSNSQPPSPFFGNNGPFDIGTELSNIPAAALPSIILFVVLTILYIVLLGPANFTVLRRMRRRELSWVTVPSLAVVCVGATFGVAVHLKGSTVMLNTASVIQLSDNGPSPASMYVGLFAPVQGDYHLAVGAPALPSMIPTYYYYGGPNGPARSLGLTFQEGPRTDIAFNNMNMWSMRSVAIRTSVNIPGRITDDLQIDRNGELVGTIHNGTNLDLVKPAIVAGTSHFRLKDLPAGATERVHFRPQGSVYDYNYRPLWFKLYGNPPQFYGGYYGKPFFGGILNQGPGPGGGFFGGGGPGPGYCCPGPTPPQEKTLLDRLRDTAGAMPAAASPTAYSEITLVGWTQQSLGSLSVDGTVPTRRDLSLIEAPLSVHWPAAGSFRLRTGTLGATLVNVTAGSASGGCCYAPGSRPIFISYGGSATFAFHIPNAQHTQFKTLQLWLNAGGADGTDIGRVYDVRSGKWVKVDLSTGETDLKDPQRFIGPNGDLLIKIQSASDSSYALTPNQGNVTISDPHLSLQISGQVTVH